MQIFTKIKSLKIDTEFLQKKCACYFRNGMEISKEQHTDEPFTMMVWMAMDIIYCLRKQPRSAVAIVKGV